MSKEEPQNNPMFTAFQNLNLHSNNNEEGEIKKSNNNQGLDLSNNNEGLDFSNSNHNLHIQYNYGHVSLGGTRLSAPNLDASPFLPSWMTQPGTSFSTKSSNDLDLDLLYGLLNMMKSPSHSEFLGHLERIILYDSAKKEILFSTIGILLTRNRSTFLDLALNKHSSHALRLLLKRSPSLDGFIFQAVCRNFFTLMNSGFGRHLIIPLIRAVEKPMKEMIYQLTYENALVLAEQAIGCIALNSVFQEIKGQFRDLIFDRIAQNALWLAFDPYGTYVVQNFLALHNPRATQAIADNLYGSFIKLAMTRQGSYVVEKCLNTEYGIEKVLGEFMRNDREWIRLASDRFGNFVVQNALRVMKQRGMRELVREFVEKLRPHFGEMKFGYGKGTLMMIQEEIEIWLHVSG